MLGIEPSIFEEKYKITFDRSIKLTIDEDLLKRRNTIAHGEFLSVSIQEYKELYQVIVNGLLYNFKEIVMDAAQTKSYKRKIA